MAYQNPFMTALAQGANASNQTMSNALNASNIASNLFNSAGSLALKMNALLEEEEANKQKQLMDQAEYLRKLQKDAFEKQMEEKRFKLEAKKVDNQSLHWWNQDMLDQRKAKLEEKKFGYDVFKDTREENELNKAAEYIAKRRNISIPEAKAFLKENPNALEYQAKKDEYGNMIIFDPLTGRIKTLSSLGSGIIGNNNNTSDLSNLPLKKQIEMLDIKIQTEKNPKIKEQLLTNLNILKEKYNVNKKHYDTEYNAWKTINVVLANANSASQIAFNTQGSIFKWAFGGKEKVKENLLKLSTKHPVAVKGLSVVSDIIDDDTTGIYNVEHKIEKGVNYLSKKIFNKSIPMIELKKRLWGLVKDEFGSNIIMLDKKSINALKQHDPELGSLYEQYRKEKDEKKKYILKQKITQHEQRLVPVYLNAYENLIKSATRKAFLAGKIDRKDDERAIIEKAIEYAVEHPQEFGNSTQEDIINFITVSNGLLLDFIGNGKINFR